MAHIEPFIYMKMFQMCLPSEIKNENFKQDLK